MKNKSYYLLYTLLGLFITATTYAEVKLPAIVSSNMVLQRNTTITLWGWADAREKITISPFWLYEPLDIAANEAGTWKVEVQTTNSNSSMLACASNISAIKHLE